MYNLQISNVGRIFENIDSGILAGRAVSRRRRGEKIIRLMTIQYRAIIAAKGYPEKQRQKQRQRERERERYPRTDQIQY